MKSYYILLVEQIATKKEKTLLSGSKTEATHVLEGSLWYSDGSKDGSTTGHSQSNLNCASSGSKIKQSDLNLQSLDFDNTKLLCSFADVGKIKEEEHLLLCALSSFSDRVLIFRDDKWWSEVTRIQVHCYVWVLGKGSRKENKMLGRVRYRGLLPQFKGIWFGVELSVDHHGEGSTDGHFRKKSYFECPEDCGLFVHLGRLRLCEDSHPDKFPSPKSQKHKYPTPVQHQEGGELPLHTLSEARAHKTNVHSRDLTPPPLSEGERVVWISDHGPESGVVKWIGFLPDAKAREWTVGVEFDKPIGTGTGKYKDQQLFRAKQDHASLVPIMGLVKEDQMYGTSQPVSEAHVSRHRITPTGTARRDYRHMDQITKTQDYLLRQYEDEYTRGTSGAKAGRITSPTEARQHPNQPRGPPTMGKQAQEIKEKSIYDGQPVYENMATDGDQQFQRPSQIAAGNSMEAIYGDVHFPGRPGQEEKKDSMEHNYEPFDIHVPGSPLPMTDKHKQILQSNFETLISNLAMDGILDVLVSRGIIDINEHDQLLAMKSRNRTSAASALLRLLLRREDQAFYLFIQACKTYSMGHLAKLLEDADNPDRQTMRMRSPTEPYPVGSTAKSRMKDKNRQGDYYGDYHDWKEDQYGHVTNQRQIPVGPPMGRIESDSPAPMSPTAQYSSTPHRNLTEPLYSSARPKQRAYDTDYSKRSKTEPILPAPIRPQTLDPADVHTDFEIGSLVEVFQNPPECRYGVVRWIGFITDKTRPFVGLEMEEENASCTDGTFGKNKLFDCAPKKAYFTYMSKIRKDGRFDESLRYTERRESQAFGSTDCPDIPGIVTPPFWDRDESLEKFTGKGRGVQGHHNSCYMDATLFSMFAFSIAFDTLLHRQRSHGDIARYEEVQQVLRDGIVNPLRKEFFVRADKVLRLRSLLDELSDVKGLMTEEKDPEEFFNCLLQQIMQAEPFIKLSSGQMSHYYQLFVEKDDRIMLPTTQQLLELSFLQSDIKLAEVPSCLILQMPRFGKDFKVYKRIVPSPYLDITDILETGPRECTICGVLASHECKDCYSDFGERLDKIAFCENCMKRSHSHMRRSNHKSRPIPINEEYREHLEMMRAKGVSAPCIQREVLELFAVICIETSHYVSFVKCGSGEHAPWMFFDSMADRMGEQNGYNVPEVSVCDDLPEWLLAKNKERILSIQEDRELPAQMRRLLCDSYICLYQSPLLVEYK